MMSSIVSTAASSACDPTLPSFETALQEQLGLKLERYQGAVDVLVIDSVSMPTPN
jgi:uncharacterized protein (TIGR03435 family)